MVAVQAGMDQPGAVQNHNHRKVDLRRHFTRPAKGFFHEQDIETSGSLCGFGHCAPLHDPTRPVGVDPHEFIDAGTMAELYRTSSSRR